MRDAITKGLQSLTWGGITQSFGYDGFGRIAAESTSTSGYGPQAEGFTYDAAGNRTGAGASFTYSNTNEVRRRDSLPGDALAPGDSVYYDAAGNSRRWKNLTTGEVDSLFWDAESRLIRVKRRNASGSTVLNIQYRYDGFGRRVRAWGTGTSERLYVWNGWELLGETDAEGVPVRRYTHHPEAIDFPLAMWDDFEISPFHRDGQGNVYRLTDTTGADQSTYRYRAWGDRHTVGTENVQSPFTYKAREEDRETGLIYMRHRYYSPRLERFLNEDPIGLAGGLNVFRFVDSDPVNNADPTGLCAPFCIVGAAIAGGLLGVAFDYVLGKVFGHDPSGPEMALSFMLGATTGAVGKATMMIVTTPAKYGVTTASTVRTVRNANRFRDGALTGGSVASNMLTASGSGGRGLSGGLSFDGMPADATGAYVGGGQLVGTGGYGHLFDACFSSADTVSIGLPDGSRITVTYTRDCDGNITISIKGE